MTRRQYAGGAAATTITTPISAAGGGTVAIATSTGWPDGAVGKFHVVIDAGNSSEEKILVDLRSGTTLTFVSGGRGADGTVSTSHAAGATIWLCSTALDFDEANAHINAPTAAHAATAVTFAPGGNISATNVQAAIVELDSEIDARTDAAETSLAALTAADSALDARLDLVEANDWVTFAKLGPTAVSRWSRSTTQAVGATTEVVISWTTETEDDLSLAVPTFTVITMPAGSDGWWGIDLAVTLDAAPVATSVFGMHIGSRQYRQPSVIQAVGTSAFSWNVYLVATNTLDFRLFNGGSGGGGGGAFNITAASLSMARLAKIA